MLKFCTWSNLLLRFLKSFTQVTWMVWNNPYRRSTNSSALQSFPLALDVWLSPRASLFCVNRSIGLVDMSITVESWWTSTQDLCGRNRSNSSERNPIHFLGQSAVGLTWRYYTIYTLNMRLSSMYSLVSILYIVYPRIAQTMYFWDCYLDQTDYPIENYLW